MVCFTFDLIKSLFSIAGGFLEQENVAHFYFQHSYCQKTKHPHRIAPEFYVVWLQWFFHVQKSNWRKVVWMGNYVRCQNLNSSCIWTVEYNNLTRPDDCRYEIYLDEVKPNDLSVNFLQEFMDLPTFYLAPGAAIKFRKYLLCLSIL